MALYKNLDYLKISKSPAFDDTFTPGQKTPTSGIYRCEVCGHEDVSTKDHPLPTQNHRQHKQFEPIRWRLIVAAHVPIPAGLAAAFGMR